MKYSFTRGLKKAVISFLIYGFSVLPGWLEKGYPTIAGLSVGAAITLLANYLKVKLKSRIQLDASAEA